ncbi:MAG TPA: AAA family ATPase [Solirubrobacteraceae bacterium]
MSLLLERERELACVGVRLDAARGGVGGLVVVEGPSGLGKSSLLRAAAVEGLQRGFEVARARGAELEREWPFGIARQLLEPVLRRCSSDERAGLLGGAARLAAHVVLPELAAGAAAVDVSFGTLHGLYWLCANLATRRPLLIVVDDAQWADETSLRFLGVLARRLDALPAVVLLAQRPLPPNALAELSADPQSDVLELRPLSCAAILALLSQWSPDGVDAQFALACEAATNGNPFLLSRLAQGLREQEIACTAEHISDLTSVGTQVLRRTVGATLGRLPATAIALADAVAVLGDDVELSLAAQLARIQEGAADAAAEELVRAAVLEDARPLRFVHAIVRDVVAARLSAGARGSLHARAAELLVGRDAAPDAVAVHLLATEPRGRPWVVERLMTSARQALDQGAPQTALRRLERALAEPPATAALRAQLLLDLGCTETLLGRREALAHLHAAHALAPAPVLRARAVLGLTRVTRPTPNVGELISLLEHAIGELDGDRELTLELEAARLTLQIASGTAGELQRFADLQGYTPAERLMLAQLALAQLCAGGPADVAAQFAERAVCGPHADAIANGGLSLLFAPYVLCRSDRLDAAERVAERELHAARQRGSLAAYVYACTIRGQVALRRGTLCAAEAEYRAGLDALPPDTGPRRESLIAGLLDVLVQTGELRTAQTLLDSAGHDRALPDDAANTNLLASRSRLRFAQGDTPRALADALEARRRSIRHGGVQSADWAAWSLIVSLHHALNQRQEARREADALLDATRRWGTPGAIGQALRTRGLIEGGESGLALLRDAVEHLKRSPARLEHAYALVDYGAALRRSGNRRAARDPLRQGLDIAAACSANPLADRARQELTATGLRVRRDAQTGIAALTPSQRRITEHAAAGATNAQIAQALFITVKTVEMHLHHAYRKLNINSRHQLAQCLQDHTTAQESQPTMDHIELDGRGRT